MNNYVVAGLVGLGIGLLLGLLLYVILKRDSVKNALAKGGAWCATNGLKVITGNDGNISHTRIINLAWAFSAMKVVIHAAATDAHIQPEVLVFIGTAMGLSGLTTIMNKIQEVKQKVAGANDDTNQN